MTIRAIYENGVFRPTQVANLPDGCEVELEIHEIKVPAGMPALDDVYAIVSDCFATGEDGVAQRHDEHQP